MAVREPQTAGEYDDRTTSAVKSVLIEIGQILGSFEGKFAVIGGAVPWLLLGEAEGTSFERPCHSNPVQEPVVAASRTDARVDVRNRSTKGSANSTVVMTCRRRHPLDDEAHPKCG